MADLEDELTKDMLEFLDKLVATGNYRDRGDVVRHILRAVMESAEKKKGESPPEPSDTGGEVVIQLKTIQDL